MAVKVAAIVYLAAWVVLPVALWLWYRVRLRRSMRRARTAVTLTDPSDSWKYRRGDVLAVNGHPVVVDDADCGLLHFKDATRWERFKAWARGCWRRLPR